MKRYINRWKDAIDTVSSPVNCYHTLRGSGINSPGAFLMVAFSTFMFLGMALIGKDFE